jgi:amino acid adenylation domain-containing protein
VAAGARMSDQIRPLSYAQLRLWLLDRLEPGSATYNIGRVLRLRGRLAEVVLRHSLQAVVARHELLRTSFVEIEGEPIQVIAQRRSVELAVVDLSGVPDSETEALRRARAEAQRPFDLSNDTLLRATLLRLGPEEHLLLLVMHHIVTDAWSMGVLFEELGHHYVASITGRPAAVPDLRLQYGDFARWQQTSLRGPMLDTQIDYWRSRLADVDPVLELPTDRPRPVVRTSHGAIERAVFPVALRERLKAVGRDASATLFMTLLATFAVLLARYTGRDDLVVGSPTAGRRDVDLENLIGFFVNTLVLRTDLSGDPTFLELLERVRATTLDAYEHQDVPFEKIIADLNVPRSLSHSPLLQVMFILQNAPRHQLKLPGLTLHEIEFDPGTAKFDLTVDMAEVDEGLSCAVEYSTDLFEASTITRLVDHLHALLEAVAADPAQRVSALPMMRASEQQLLVTAWNDTAADYPHQSCLHQLFDLQATRTPDALALIDGERRLTYRELQGRANRLAHYLRARGVGPGGLVGACLERSAEAFVGLLGILKAGAAYVPLDPAYPPSRLAFMLADCGAPVVVTMAHLRDRLVVETATVIDLDADRAAIAREPLTTPDDAAGPRDLAYVIYTSGSTGTPKGVLAVHEASVNRFAWMWRQWPFTRHDVCCQKTSLSFVDSVWEIFGPLLQGVPNVIVPDEVLGDPARLVDLLATHRVTRIVLVPSVLKHLLDTIPDVARRLPDLRFWVTSGEAIPVDVARRFAALLPGATLLNLYGSSEVAADVSAYVVTGSGARERIPIGRPIANTRLYVLDRHANPVPIGVPGEIHVGGAGLARGYLHDADLTARKFVPDPFVGDAPARLYRTGDVGRFLADGNLEYLGRVDNQVKLRGVRIELGEIESVLRTHPSLRDAVALVSEAAGGARLIAYIVADGRRPESSELRRFARERLPDHTVPSAFFFLDALPMTPSGKLDRRALLSLAPKPAEDARTYVAPRTATEDALATIMAEVLKVDRVGIHDDFFELGGHSLLAIRVIARVRKILRVELPMRSLFAEPTVAGLGPEVERIRDSGAIPAMPQPTRGFGSREQLQARLAGLSDAEVEALLARLDSHRPGERETETF